MKLSDALKYLSGRALTPAGRLVAVYLAGWLLLIAGYFAGITGPMIHRAGTVALLVAILVSVHVYLALRTVGRLASNGDFAAAEASTAWLEKVDASILGIGFLGKLYAIATALQAVGSTSDPAAALAGISTITSSVSAALYATMAGLAVSLWTHCATLVVSNFVAAGRDMESRIREEVFTMGIPSLDYRPTDAELVDLVNLAKGDGNGT
jgi:hypothetical protein